MGICEAQQVGKADVLVPAWLQALLRRVFDTAAELWREEVGALLHSRNYQKMGEAFRAWQLHVLERQEQRRQQILWNAAVAFRQVALRSLHSSLFTLEDRPVGFGPLAAWGLQEVEGWGLLQASTRQTACSP